MKPEIYFQVVCHHGSRQKNSQIMETSDLKDTN